MGKSVQIGDVLAGKYRVERVLGEGGMGVVLAVSRVGLGDLVALKVMLGEVAKTPAHVARFTREAQAAVKIKSEHVTRIIDVGTLESGLPYIAMDLLEGEDLAQRLAREGRMGVEEAVGLLQQACEGVAAAHRAGVIHRDLKPANLFLTRRPDGSTFVKVLDFGVSKLTGDDDLAAMMTGTSTVLGSPAYMSPEQLRSSRDVDARADLWSLGAVAYQILTGRLPFQLESIAELCAAILGSPVRPLRDLRHDAPIALEAVIMRCLEKDRERRFRTAEELAEALIAAAPTGRVDTRAARARHAAPDDDDEPATRMMASPPEPPGIATVALPGARHVGEATVGEEAPAPTRLMPVARIEPGPEPEPVVGGGAIAPIATPPQRHGWVVLGTALGVILLGAVFAWFYFRPP